MAAMMRFDWIFIALFLLDLAQLRLAVLLDFRDFSALHVGEEFV
jgi:hypothetical protein